MARSGTTFTTHLLFSSKEFASLQYRDLPFYKIVIFWSYFSKIYYGNERFNKRIHGDELYVSQNSPDAFEELIWKNNLHNYLDSGFFRRLDEKYKNILLENELDNIIKKTLFIKKENRYLSKNNYNIFRLKYLIKLYKDANFIILFRDPIETILSLSKVHEKFIDYGKNNKKFGEELEILGHHEFGPKRKAFDIGKNYHKTINYWNAKKNSSGYLLQWIDLYSYVLNEYKSLIESKKILLLNFSRNLDYTFCDKLINYCKINNSDNLSKYFKTFVLKEEKIDHKLLNFDKDDLDRSYDIYKSLVKLSNI